MRHFLGTLPVLFALGTAGALHCAGMCGGIAALAGGMRRPGRFALYLAGKASSYALLGALAGAAGRAILESAPLGWGARALALSAGVLLLLAGLESLGFLRVPGLAWLARAGREVARLAGAGPEGALLMGAANGLFPCPMVYTFAAMAALTGSPVWGAATMLVLAATSAVPLALCSALGGRFAGFRRLAALLMIATGVLTLHRVVAAPTHGAGHAVSPAAPVHHHVP